MLTNSDKVSRTRYLRSTSESHHHVSASKPVVAQVLEDEIVVHLSELRVVRAETELIDEIGRVFHESGNSFCAFEFLGLKSGVFKECLTIVRK